MLISIPTNGNKGYDDEVCQHFGQARYFTLYDSEKKEIKFIDNTSEHQGGTGLPPELMHSEGVEIMLCGGMGGRAIQMFSNYGIKVFTGMNGTVKNAIDLYENGKLKEADLSDSCKSPSH